MRLLAGLAFVVAVLAGGPAASADWSALMGKTAIVKYRVTITEDTKGAAGSRKTWTCERENHFYFSTQRKLFDSRTFSRCSNSDSVRRTPEATEGSVYDFAHASSGNTGKGTVWSIKTGGSSITLTTRSDTSYVSDDKKWRSKTRTEYQAVFSVTAKGCGFKRSRTSVSEQDNGYASPPERSTVTTTERTSAVTCRLVDGKA